MEKPTFPTPEERGLFKGLGTPPSLNAILLAFVGIVIFLVGAKAISIALSEISHQKLSYERFVLQLRDKAVETFPVVRYPIDNIFVPIFIPTPVPKNSSAIRFEVESRWSREWGKWSDEERKSWEEELRKWEEKRDEWVKANQGKDVGEWEKENPPPEFKKPPKTVPWWVYLIYGFWFIVIWGLFAGAVNRIYAYRIGRDESITIREAMSYGLKTWGTHIFSAVLIGAFIAVIFFGCVLLTAIFGKIPYLNYPGQVLLIPGFVLILIAAFVIGFIVVILLFSFDLISSAIAVERTDPFDAISRAYAYVTERPWHTLLYTGLALLFILFFLYFGEVAIGTAKKILAFGLGTDYDHIAKYIDKEGVTYKEAFADSQVTLGWLGGALYYILWVTRVFIVATAVALWLASRTKAYLLLRNEVDGDETDEIYIEEEELVEEVRPPSAPEEKREEEKVEEKKEEVEEEEKEEEKVDEKKAEEKPKRGRAKKKAKEKEKVDEKKAEEKPKRGRAKKKAKKEDDREKK